MEKQRTGNGTGTLVATRSTSSLAAPPSSAPPVPRRATEMTDHEWRQARADLLRQR